jgi:hypothetical protein
MREMAARIPAPNAVSPHDKLIRYFDTDNK